MNLLAIVAHADDETLFMGGTLHHLRAHQWKIVCVTKDIEHGRDPQFMQMCRTCSADGEILGMEMGWRPRVPRWDMRALKRAIKMILVERKWDRVYTHNRVGEYGHPQHVLVSDSVRAAAREAMVPVWMFGEGSKDPAIATMLTADDRAFKRMLAETYTRKTKAIKSYPFFDVEQERFVVEDARP